jgi:hypothetical protein
MDVVLHWRTKDGDGLVVVEAKKPFRLGGKLSDKDKNPGTYLDVPEFAAIKTKVFVNLVHESDAVNTRSFVRDTKRHGVLTWTALGQLQTELAASVTANADINSLLSRMIATSFVDRGIKELSDASRGYDAMSPEALATEHDRVLNCDTQASSIEGRAGQQIQAACLVNTEPHVAQFLAAAVQHHFCKYSIMPTTLAFPYLRSEPPIESIVNGFQETWERRVCLWKLPVRN